MMRAIQSAVHAIALVLWVVGSSPQAPSAVEFQDQGLFRALLAHLSRDRTSALSVVQVTPLGLRKPSASDWAWFGLPTNALQTKVDGAGSSASANFRPESFPPTTALLPEENLQRLRRALKAPDSREAWGRFRQQYNVQAVYAFSNPIVTDDGLNAFVVYSFTCGPQCGQSGFALLYRASRDASWNVVKELPTAIS
jgi:hypothetical protein